MKVFLLAFFVAAALAAPTPLEDDAETVEFIVNGVPEGHALELGNILDIKVKEHVDGVLASSTNPLHAYTAVGLAEAAAAAAEAENSIVIPEPVVLPAPVLPEIEIPKDIEVVIPEPVVLPVPPQPEVVIPEPIVLPAPAQPEVVPEPVVLPAPAQPEVVPEPIVLPAPAQPEVVPEPIVLPPPVQPEVEIAEEIPVPAPQIPNGEVFNNGVVQVHLNTPQDAGVFATLQSWFNMAINYFNGDVQTTHQIV